MFVNGQSQSLHRVGSWNSRGDGPLEHLHHKSCKVLLCMSVCLLIACCHLSIQEIQYHLILNNK